MEKEEETKSNEPKENKKGNFGIKEGEYNKYHYCMFFYFLIGAVIAYCAYLDIPIGILGIFSVLYLYSFIIAIISYFIIGSFGDYHKSFLMNIVDAVVAFFAIRLAYLSQFQTFISLLVGGVYSFIPLVFSHIDNNNFDIIVIIKTFTRFLMLLFIVFIVFLLNSCGAGIDG